MVLCLLPVWGGGCDVRPDPVDDPYVRAKIKVPEEHPDGPSERVFAATGKASETGGDLVIKARSGSDALFMTIDSFPDREGVFEMGSSTSFGAWGSIPSSCSDWGPTSPPPCTLTHTSRQNWGYLVVTTYRSDQIAGTFNFRAHDPNEPETSLNLTDGELNQPWAGSRRAESALPLP
ncbi:MAG: hypothetical protein HYV63_04165 [Candidatus Schekmanbacteria bacterium]|nr:hypothetical protein [Candidatus Schekmanbacteria bacterium]